MKGVRIDLPGTYGGMRRWDGQVSWLRMQDDLGVIQWLSRL